MKSILNGVVGIDVVRKGSKAKEPAKVLRNTYSYTYSYTRISKFRERKRGEKIGLYRMIVETLLGLRLEADRLSVAPRLPRAWNSLKLHYRYRDTFYHISVKRVAAETTQPIGVTVDGKAQPGATIQLVDDRREHAVAVQVL